MRERRRAEREPRRRVLDRPIRWFARLPWILLLPVGLALQWAAARFPAFADGWAGFAYPLTAKLLGSATGWVPFSVGEVLLLSIAVWSLAALWRNVRSVRLGARRLSNVLAHGAVDALALVGLLYGGGMLLWGVNYHRTPLAERVGYDVSPASAGELRALTAALIAGANAERLGLDEDDAGVMRLSHGRRRTLARAWLGFYRAGQWYEPLAAGHAGPAKGFAVLSTPLSYLGLSGVFFLFTGEPSVNTSLPDAALPFTACHEVAHQVGFAREEEANFAGWLACTHHPDPEFRYSAQLAALRYAMGELQRVDPEARAALLERCSPKVVRDWQALSEFWRRHASPVRGVAEDVNDLYLRSQGQQAGVASYVRMVDLLVAHHRFAEATSGAR